MRTVLLAFCISIAACSPTTEGLGRSFDDAAVMGSDAPAGSAAEAPASPAPDLAVVMAPDAATMPPEDALMGRPDLATTPDLSVAPDLAPPLPDLASGPEAALPDLSTPDASTDTFVKLDTAPDLRPAVVAHGPELPPPCSETNISYYQSCVAPTTGALMKWTVPVGVGCSYFCKVPDTQPCTAFIWYKGAPAGQIVCMPKSTDCPTYCLDPLNPYP